MKVCLAKFKPKILGVQVSVGLLKEIAPGIKRITLMFNPPTAPWFPFFLRELGPASASLAVECVI
jgi:hypothetical protein